MDRTRDEILDQAVYTVACVAHHYGPGYSDDGLQVLRESLDRLIFCTDVSFRERYDHEPYIDFVSRIIWPEDWDKLDFEETVRDSRGGRVSDNG